MKLLLYRAEAKEAGFADKSGCLTDYGKGLLKLYWKLWNENRISSFIPEISAYTRMLISREYYTRMLIAREYSGQNAQVRGRDRYFGQGLTDDDGLTDGELLRGTDLRDTPPPGRGLVDLYGPSRNAGRAGSSRYRPSMDAEMVEGLRSLGIDIDLEELKRGDAERFVVLGRSAMKRGDAKAASECFEKARRLNTDYKIPSQRELQRRAAEQNPPWWRIDIGILFGRPQQQEKSAHQGYTAIPSSEVLFWRKQGAEVHYINGKPCVSAEDYRRVISKE